MTQSSIRQFRRAIKKKYGLDEQGLEQAFREGDRKQHGCWSRTDFKAFIDDLLQLSDRNRKIFRKAIARDGQKTIEIEDWIAFFSQSDEPQPAQPTSKPMAFVSYARGDIATPIAEAFASKLEASGWRAWFDAKSIKQGAIWEDAIGRGVKDSKCFIALIDKKYNTSRFCW